jgi:hypothetical protein
MIVAFSVVVHAFEFIGLKNAVFFSLTEITHITQLQASPALIAALTSFGGVCILFQVAAISRGRIRLQKFLLARIPIAALSAGICGVLVKILPAFSTQTLPEMRAVHNIAAIAGRRTVLTSSDSVIASSCLIVMTLILIKTTHSEKASNTK